MRHSYFLAYYGANKSMLIYAMHQKAAINCCKRVAGECLAIEYVPHERANNLGVPCWDANEEDEA